MDTIKTIKPDRIDFIDLAKGICIILVVAYHCGLGGLIPGDKQLRMPLYFVLSGLFFKDYGKESLIKKINKLLIPYVTFYILGDLFYWGAFKLGALPSSPKSIPIIDIFIGGVPSNMPIWFLLCLFNCYTIFLFIKRISKNELQIGILSILSGMIGVGLYYFEPTFPMFFINSAFSSLPFFYLGYILKKHNVLTSKKNKITSFVAGGVIYCVSVCFIVFCPDSKLSVFDNIFHGNIIVGYIVSSLLVLSIMFVCKSIKRLPYVSYIGRYSIVILLIHVPIMDMMYYIQRAYFHYEANWLRFLLTLLLSSLLIPLMIKKLPYVTAQKDLLTYGRLKRLQSINLYFKLH